MPTSPFTITTGSSMVVLNTARQGTVTFTVTNISGQALRGRGVTKPLGPTGVDWLSIVGRAEHDFGIGATQQYIVQVAVPPDAAPGDYTFRLDAVGVDNPDETFTQGPGVQFQVAPLPVPLPPPPPKPFPWRIVAIAAGILVLCALIVVVWLLIRPPPLPSRALVAKVGNNFTPDLAESWQISNAGKRWTFKLVEDVTLRDGRPFTSREAEERLAATWSQVRSGNITIQIVDEYTLIFQLISAPNFNVLDELSRVTFTILG